MKEINKYEFSVEVAKMVGFEEAVMFSNIYFWVNYNAKEGSTYNHHEGKYWTFNTVKYFTEQYPFWSVSVIRRIFRNLEKAGLIETGRFNKYRYDKTKWYTLTEKGFDIIRTAKGIVKIDTLNGQN